MDKQFVFITGLPKSGTTWLFKLLNSSYKVHGKYEGHLFFSNGAYSLYDSIKEGISEKWFDFIYHRKNNWIGLDNEIHTIGTTNYISDHIRKKTLERNVEIMTGSYVKEMMIRSALDNKNYKDLEIIIDKTPVADLGKMKRILNSIPEAKVLYIERDARDWIPSAIIAHHRKCRDESFYPNIEELWKIIGYNGAIQTSLFYEGKRNTIVDDKVIEQLKMFWTKMGEEARNIRSERKNFEIVHYDKMFHNPVEVFLKICDYIGLGVTLQEAERIIEETGSNNPDKTKRYTDNGILISGEPGVNRKLIM